MNELLLVVTIAGERVALPAASVESVVELDTLIAVPRAAPHVAGLSALRSRVLTVIDCKRSLELGESDRSDGIREAAVVDFDKPILIAYAAPAGAAASAKLASISPASIWPISGLCIVPPFEAATVSNWSMPSTMAPLAASRNCA